MSAREDAIRSIEKVLSEIGLHGGNVVIETDPQKSSSGNNVAKKPSIGGVKARRFLGFHGKLGKINLKKGTSNIKYNQWKALRNAVKDHGDDERARNRKARVWQALDAVFFNCDKSHWSENDMGAFKKELNNFKNCMRDAWTYDNFTHYMVRNQLVQNLVFKAPR